MESTSCQLCKLHASSVPFKLLSEKNLILFAKKLQLVLKVAQEVEFNLEVDIVDVSMTHEDRLVHR